MLVLSCFIGEVFEVDVYYAILTMMLHVSHFFTAQGPKRPYQYSGLRAPALPHPGRTVGLSLILDCRFISLTTLGTRSMELDNEFGFSIFA